MQIFLTDTADVLGRSLALRLQHRGHLVVSPQESGLDLTDPWAIGEITLRHDVVLHTMLPTTYEAAAADELFLCQLIRNMTADQMLILPDQRHRLPYLNPGQCRWLHDCRSDLNRYLQKRGNLRLAPRTYVLASDLIYGGPDPNVVEVLLTHGTHATQAVLLDIEAVWHPVHWRDWLTLIVNCVEAGSRGGHWLCPGTQPAVSARQFCRWIAQRLGRAAHPHSLAAAAQRLKLPTLALQPFVTAEFDRREIPADPDSPPTGPDLCDWIRHAWLPSSSPAVPVALTP